LDLFFNQFLSFEDWSDKLPAVQTTADSADSTVQLRVLDAEYLEKYGRNRKPQFRIKLWEHPRLEHVIGRRRSLLHEYDLIEETIHSFQLTVDFYSEAALNRAFRS
jgi:hypothetical protein